MIVGSLCSYVVVVMVTGASNRMLSWLPIPCRLCVDGSDDIFWLDLPQVASSLDFQVMKKRMCYSSAAAAQWATSCIMHTCACTHTHTHMGPWYRNTLEQSIYVSWTTCTDGASICVAYENGQICLMCLLGNLTVTPTLCYIMFMTRIEYIRTVFVIKIFLYIIE